MVHKITIVEKLVWMTFKWNEYLFSLFPLPNVFHPYLFSTSSFKIFSLWYFDRLNFLYGPIQTYIINLRRSNQKLQFFRFSTNIHTHYNEFQNGIIKIQKCSSIFIDTDLPILLSHPFINTYILSEYWRKQFCRSLERF